VNRPLMVARRGYTYREENATPKFRGSGGPWTAGARTSWAGGADQISTPLAKSRSVAKTARRVRGLTVIC